MRKDQDATRLRGLDEAERGDRLAGAGRMLEPEALGGVRVLGLIRQRLLFVLVLVDPVARLLLGIALLLELVLRLVVLVGAILVELVVLFILVVVVLVRRGALYRPELVVVLVEIVLVLFVFVFVLLSAVAYCVSDAGGRRLAAVGRRRVRAEDVGRRKQLGEADAAPRPLPSAAVRCASASSAVSVPDSAST